MATPYVTISCDEVTSTQDLATTELRRLGEPVLIVASRQTAGRGRSGTEWWTAPAAVAASLAFSNRLMRVDDTFPLAVGIAVRESLDQAGYRGVMLKWPNDLLVNGAKVGGIIVERDDRRTVVGCGLNLWWPEPPPGVAALAPTEPAPETRLEVSQGWASTILATGGAWDRSIYRRLCATLGTEITWGTDGRGRAVDVDEQGGLVVAAAHGQVTLRSGEVQTVRAISDDV